MEAPPDPAATVAIERRAQMYPTLTPEQVEEARPFGQPERIAAGAWLWEVGQRALPFYIVLEGVLEVVRRDAFGAETVLVRLEPGTFSGETATLAGRAAMVSGRAATELEVLTIPAEKLRELVVTRARIGELIMRAFILRRMRLISERASDLLLVGSRFCPGTLQLQEFLTRNGHPYTFLDLEAVSGMCTALDRLNIQPRDIPLVITSSGEPLRNPSLRAVGERLGLSPVVDPQRVYDVAVIGAGPAGLASAVYAASEGLDVVVLDSIAPGGQAGTSSKIENYLGFPTGVSGQALASRAFLQAQKFGASMLIPARLAALQCGNPYHRLELDNGEHLHSRSVVVASGAHYQKPALPNLADFEGLGVYYGATHVESQMCQTENVVIIGAGNSAGQAAVFLAETASRVHVIARSAGLAASMSQYLIRRIEATPKIELVTHTEVVALEGHNHLERVCWRNRLTGEQSWWPARHLFVFIGATPNTDFLPVSVLTDERGFVCTGAAVMEGEGAALWPLGRPPHPLESSCPGVFAAGDVRATSTKRVASAVGEGSVAVQYIHKFLAERGRGTTLTPQDVAAPAASPP